MRTQSPFSNNPFQVPLAPNRGAKRGTDFFSLMNDRYAYGDDVGQVARGSLNTSFDGSNNSPISDMFTGSNNPIADMIAQFGENTPDIFKKRSMPGKKDNVSLGDTANMTYDLMKWLASMGGDLTGGTYDLFGKLLGGEFPDALEGHYPTRFAGDLQKGTDTLADAWTARAKGIRSDFLDSSVAAQKTAGADAMAAAQGLLDSSLNQGRDMIHDQGAANQANAMRQIDEEMSGGMRAKMQGESIDKRVGSEAQAIQKMVSELTQSTMVPTLLSNQQGMQQSIQQALGQAMGMEAAGQLNIENMNPNILSALMTSVFPGYNMAAMQAGTQIPSQLAAMLTAIANIRTAGRQTADKGGGILSGLGRLFS